MTLKSMTGFARASGEAEGFSWVWEVRSVNGKGLDVRVRMPPGLEALEPDIRKAAARRFKRGNFQANLHLSRAAEAASMSINTQLLEWYVAQARKLAQTLGDDAAPADPVRLLAMRGVVEATDQTLRLFEDLGQDLLASLEEALDALAAARAEEGARLAEIIEGQIGRIEELTRQARHNPARSADAIRARLKEQVKRLLEAGEGLDEERLHQEAVLLATRADIAEELDRLDAHVAAARALLEENGPVGRKFDFLAQEFNREANTLCSKSNDAELTRTGLELKVVIDQLREQLANVE